MRRLCRYNTSLIKGKRIHEGFKQKKADRKEVSDLNMPLGSFVTGYDPQFKRDFMSLYPNGANDIEQNIVFFDDNSKTLDYAPKVYINVHELAGDNFDVCLHVKDHMYDENGKPRVFCGAYDSNCPNYSDVIP